MRSRISAWLGIIASASLVATSLPAQTVEKRPLDHDSYDLWNSLQGEQISRDGLWFSYQIEPEEGDATLFVRRTDGTTAHEFGRGTQAEFTADSRYVVFQIEPMEAAVEAAEEEGLEDAELPQDSLGILDLQSGQVVRIANVSSFELPEEASDRVAYHRPEPPEDDAEDEEEDPAEEVNEALAERREDKDTGRTLVMRRLGDGSETSYSDVTSYQLLADGTLLYVAANASGTADGVFRVTAGGAASPILTGEGTYEELAVDEEQTRVAFLTTRDFWTSEDEELGRTVYVADTDGGEARPVAREGAAGIPEGWWVSEHGSLDFSADASRLFIGTAPRPEPEPEEEGAEDELIENVEVDIWHWQDPLLMTQQLEEVEDELERTWEAVVFLDDDDRIVQLEDPTLQSVSVAAEGNADVAIGEDDAPYRQIISWDTRFADIYRVDVQTGERELLASRLRGGGDLSPTGAFAYWWDGGQLTTDDPRGWMVMDLETRQVRNVTAGIDVPVWDIHDDRPAPVGPAGLAGWTADDEHMVIYDRYDLWLVDPRGAEAPRNLTAGFGRANDVSLRIEELNWEEETIPRTREILLSAFNVQTKAQGFYRTRLDDVREPTLVTMQEASIGDLAKAEDAEVLIYTRETFQDFPDLWVSDGSFGGARQMTEANPQQDEFTWGSAELVEWTSTDGEPLQGILYKPENFDPAQQWPMMVYFYERSSDGLYNYYTPSPGTSINRTFYTSRGYLVFVPDIPYKPGYPGESAVNAVTPGILALVDEGYVDRSRIGVQGHSWGGYQISYMVTRSHLFAAAEAGAPVSNMTSAYGGIRWESGRVRQMQYETGQSRIGGTLWDAQHRYIENSPLFAADKIETPLLILHNDEDGAVPWQEGIQLFAALRRLGKPSWLVNYNGQGHGVSGEFRQKDWAIRMQQFFDHYLQDAPAPVWLADGVPATMKGRTLGLELVEPAAARPLLP